MSAVCPECQQGKHQNCDGTAWDDAADAPGKCTCPDTSHSTVHEFGLRAVTGSGSLIVTCSCGWESKPVHLINTELMRERHRTEVAAK